MLNVDADHPVMSSHRFEDALPIREFFAWQGKRNYEGLWWSSTTKRHTGFESLLERQYLLTADHDQGVVGIASQPLALLWPKVTLDSNGRRLRNHVPDFFARLSNGDGRLVDVRRPDKAEAHQFMLTRELCDEIGWEYELFTGLDEQIAKTLTWLGGYRMDRYAPSQVLSEFLLDAFCPTTSLRVGIARAMRSSGLAREIVQAGAFHLIFSGSLVVDLTEPLSMDSEVDVSMEGR
ncbi:TnsA-like heteromeric transposase endonuclease subunit [Nesterenkonia sp. LB17]|uniref:TnsA-like heteromeric transposase endonuclease subunit n=1 Tax=Nesterenkonia sp. LB17 TaxID=2901230 RepID=UPI001F4C86E4|nr:TnsA-like heteromeric transposase endonuclease subunit [Nesterenkonia sp. LB17]MCH8565211.1 TnsA-like heteromeric transposase endonuclease subunit [Nesterenkonia sp. LB17]